MKLSFMTFACPEWHFGVVVAAAQRHGYHGIEFRCDAGHFHGVEITTTRDERKWMHDALHKAHVEPCCLATSLRFLHHEAVEETLPRVELAADLGIPALRVFCGPTPDGMKHAEMIDTCASHLREGVDIAAQRGVQLWLETHDSLCRAADAVAVVHAVNHPALGINYDNMHPHRVGEALETTIAQIGSLVRHTHFHDSVNDPRQVIVRPLDQGELPMDEMFRGLLKMGFNGYLSGEWFGQQYGPDPHESLETYYRDMVNLADRNGVGIGSA